jgi:hypothetical protein
MCDQLSEELLSQRPEDISRVGAGIQAVHHGLSSAEKLARSPA